MNKLILILLFSLPFSLQAQTQDSCKAYLIIQEKSFHQTGGKNIDSVFLTQNYCYRKDPMITTLMDFKAKTWYCITDFEGIRYVRKMGSASDTINLPPDPFSYRTIHLNEYKKIENIETEKRMSITSPSRSKKRLEDTTISFMATDFGFDSNQYFKGLELESDSPTISTRTLQIQEIRLPATTNWILDGCQDSSIYSLIIDTARKVYNLPSPEEVKKMAEELYGD